jgi:hypothetical protein
VWLKGRTASLAVLVASLNEWTAIPEARVGERVAAP